MGDTTNSSGGRSHIQEGVTAALLQELKILQQSEHSMQKELTRFNKSFTLAEVQLNPFDVYYVSLPSSNQDSLLLPNLKYLNARQWHEETDAVNLGGVCTGQRRHQARAASVECTVVKYGPRVVIPAVVDLATPLALSECHYQKRHPYAV